MYIEKLKLTNFRKFQDTEIEFNKWLNLFLWPNDSWKTAIIDSLKYCLWVTNYNYNRVIETDFYNDTKNLKIELFITDFSDFQASQLLDWGGLNDSSEFCLKLIFEARVWFDNQIYVYWTKWGTYESDDGWTYLEPEVKKMLEAVYLRPLRNAELELSSGKNSRLSQILLSHPLFNKDDTNQHTLEKNFTILKDTVEEYFSNEQESIGWSKYKINERINEIFWKLKDKKNNDLGRIEMDNANLSSITKNLNLLLWNSDRKPGLWTSNLLLISAELLILEVLKNNKLWCALIEEIEAHIHPQWQIRLVNYLESHSENLQIFITSHSPNIASKINLKNIFICRDNTILPMWEKYTGLSEEDYKHLGRFLDVTKSNLFFARWLILVEWIAEALIIPQLADIIYWEEWILDSHGISVVCLNWLTFDRYLNAFIRKDSKNFNIKISAITDRDFKWISFSFPKKNSDFLNWIDNSFIIENKKKEKLFNKNNYIDYLIKNKELDEIFLNNITIEFNKQCNLKKFYSKIQTLEFDMWLSCLSEKLLEARVDLWIDKDDLNDIKIKKNLYYKAKLLYKKIENKKWETAQELANILFNLDDAEKTTLKDEIKNDIYLRYIVDALNHVIEDNND